ncbi:hypothetical protein Nmel_000760 [Mimus melanotis]
MLEEKKIDKKKNRDNKEHHATQMSTDSPLASLGFTWSLPPPPPREEIHRRTAVLAERGGRGSTARPASCLRSRSQPRPVRSRRLPRSPSGSLLSPCPPSFTCRALGLYCLSASLSPSAFLSLPAHAAWCAPDRRQCRAPAPLLAGSALSAAAPAAAATAAAQHPLAPAPLRCPPLPYPAPRTA